MIKPLIAFERPAIVDALDIRNGWCRSNMFKNE